MVVSSGPTRPPSSWIRWQVLHCSVVWPKNNAFPRCVPEGFRQNLLRLDPTANTAGFFRARTARIGRGWLHQDSTRPPIRPGRMWSKGVACQRPPAPKPRRPASIRAAHGSRVRLAEFSIPEPVSPASIPSLLAQGLSSGAVRHCTDPVVNQGQSTFVHQFVRQVGHVAAAGFCHAVIKHRMIRIAWFHDGGVRNSECALSWRLADDLGLFDSLVDFQFQLCRTAPAKTMERHAVGMQIRSGAVRQCRRRVADRPTQATKVMFLFRDLRWPLASSFAGTSTPSSSSASIWLRRTVP